MKSHWNRVCNGILYTSLRTAVKSLNESGLIIASFGIGLWRVEQIPCNFIKAGLIPLATTVLVTSRSGRDICHSARAASNSQGRSHVCECGLKGQLKCPWSL